MASRPARALLVFVGAIAVFHHLPVVVGSYAHDPADLLTPFVVVAAAIALFDTLRISGRALLVAFVGAILYVDGHGIHLAANSINISGLHGRVGHLANYWDERWGHFEWHLGWFTLLAAACLAEQLGTVPTTTTRRVAGATIALLGGSLFTNTVEGGTWWLELCATAVFGAWALRERRSLLATVAASFALGAVLIGIWAAANGGMPQFSELGWLPRPK